MKSTFFALAGLMLAASGPARADFTPSAWQFRKRLPVTAEKPITAVHVDRQVFAKAAVDLSDLRVVHGSEEVPFLITRSSGSNEQKRVEAEVLDRSASGDAVQFVLALRGVARHSRIDLATGEINFKKKVKLEASADRKNWSLVRKEAYIFDFTHESQHSSILGIEYPVSTRPFLRVTIEGWKDPAVLSGASVSLAEERPAVRQIVQEFATPAPVEEAQVKATTYLLDFGEVGIPKDQLRMEITAGDLLFHRAVEVESSEDNKHWSYLARGVIYKVGGEESMWLSLPDTRARYLRVRIYHADDKPLTLRTVVAESVLRRVIFPVTTGGGDYWLYYGNRNAKTPAYDLPMVLARSSIDSASTINPGAAEPNPGYQPPPEPVKPFSDRHPQALYIALGAAVLLLGIMTVRFIQKASPSADNNS